MSSPGTSEDATGGSTFDARDGDGDPERDPAAIGEASVTAPDGDGGATPGAPERPEPGTG